MHIVHDCFVATLSLVKFLHYSSGSKQLLLLVQGLSLKRTHPKLKGVGAFYISGYYYYYQYLLLTLFCDEKERVNPFHYLEICRNNSKLHTCL